MRASLRTLVLLTLASATSGCFVLFSLDSYGPPAATDVSPSASASGGAGGGGVDGAVSELGNDGSAEPPIGDATTLSAKVVFVTSSEFAVGSLTGIQGATSADALCNAAAKQAKFSGTYVAWLSDDKTSPGAAAPGRLDLHGDTYSLVTPTGQLVAASFADLLANGPRIAIDVTETGAVLPDAPPVPSDPRGGVLKNGCPATGLVWTGIGGGTGSNFSGATDCAKWTTAEPATTGGVGRIVKDKTQWTYACDQGCDQHARLYCFQQ